MTLKDFLKNSQILMGQQTFRGYEFGSFRLDKTDRLLLRNGVPVPLTPKAFETLLVLVESNGHVVGKDRLMEAVWPNTYVEEANLTQNIFTLRRTLKAEKGGHDYIETIPRRGYRFVGHVREIEEAALLPELPGAGPSPVAVQKQRKERRGTSLAVLPFRLIGPKDKDEYLGLGLADALITKLSNLRQLAVKPTSTVCRYLDELEDPVSLGQKLHVDSILEGTIQKYGRRIRITVQLVSIPEGVTLWAEKFDERFTNIFTLEDSISERVMSTLLLKLTQEEKLQMARQHTRNHEAYKHYLKGRFFWSQSRFFRNKRVVQGLKKSIRHFEQAIQLDPNYGLAYAGLSDSYIVLSASNLLPPNDCLLLAKEAALKALEIDDAIAEAHCSLATVRMLYDWDWAGAEPEFQRAIQLNPNYITAHHWYAKYLAKVGRYTEAISEIRRAQELDPLSLVIMTEMGRLLFFARQYDQAIELCLEALHMAPNLNNAHAVLECAYTEKGMYKEALKHSQKLISIFGDDPELMAFVAYSYGKSGSREKARKVLEGWNSLGSSRPISPFYMAVIYTGMGEKEKALAWLEKAYEEHTSLLTYIKIPIFDSLSLEPEFVDLLKRMGLPS